MLGEGDAERMQDPAPARHSGYRGGDSLARGGAPKKPWEEVVPPLPKPQCPMGHPHPGAHQAPGGHRNPLPSPPQLRHGIKTSPGAPPGPASSCHIPVACRGQRPQGRIHPIPEPPQT